jgi:hypothetical protein
MRKIQIGEELHSVKLKDSLGAHSLTDTNLQASKHKIKLIQMEDGVWVTPSVPGARGWLISEGQIAGKCPYTDEEKEAFKTAEKMQVEAKEAAARAALKAAEDAKAAEAKARQEAEKQAEAAKVLPVVQDFAPYKRGPGRPPKVLG